MRKASHILLAVLLASALAFAAGQKKTNTNASKDKAAYVYGQGAPKISVGSRPVDYPAINQDGTVTFLLNAPEAKTVILRNTTGGWTTDAWPEGRDVPMQKGADGKWTVTIGPLQPEYYNYAFIVDGIYALDPGNPLVARDGIQYRSELRISGPKTANYDYHDVPHGVVSYVYVPYPTLGIQKRTTIYTPPFYEESNQRYPAVYLQHGGGGTKRPGSISVGFPR